MLLGPVIKTDLLTVTDSSIWLSGLVLAPPRRRVQRHRYHHRPRRQRYHTSRRRVSGHRRRLHTRNVLHVTQHHIRAIRRSIPKVTFTSRHQTTRIDRAQVLRRHRRRHQRRHRTRHTTRQTRRVNNTNHRASIPLLRQVLHTSR